HNIAQTDIDTAPIEELIAMTRALTVIFEEENQHLSAGDAGAIANLQAEKNRLAIAYATAIRTLATNRAGASRLDAALMETLRGLTGRFTALANDQRNILRGAQLAHKGLVDAVVSAAAGDGGQEAQAPNCPSKPYDAAGGHTASLKIGPVSVHQQA
ncbi:MAG: hypothetical protein AAF199_08535, partial [Pseudomonadota bacterium]